MNKLLGTQVAYWPAANYALCEDVEPLAGLIASVDDTDPKAIRVNIGFLNAHGSAQTAQHVPFYVTGDRPKDQPYCEDFGTVGKFSAADKKDAKAAEAADVAEHAPVPPVETVAPKPTHK